MEGASGRACQGVISAAGAVNRGGGCVNDEDPPFPAKEFVVLCTELLSGDPHYRTPPSSHRLSKSRYTNKQTTQSAHHQQHNK
eukprot:scaffold1103_cov187-Alexandrium_tamarense.AAC.1